MRGVSRRATATGGDDPPDDDRGTGRRHRDRMAQRSREQHAQVADIGEIPPAKNPARKEACRLNLKLYLQTYFPHSTGLTPFSADHDQVIARIQRCCLEGGRTGNAVYRGFAKTTITENSAIWATSYGHRRANPEVGRYAPPDLMATDRRRMQYVDDLMTICTSHVERFNCTTRMFVKRFCRLTLAFSKRLRNLEAAVAMHVANYNFVWRSRENDGQHTGRKRLPAAMQAGLIDTLWTFSDLYDAAMAA